MIDIKLIKRLFFLILENDRDEIIKNKLKKFIIFLIVTTCTEILSIISTLPFLAILLNPDAIIYSNSVKYISYMLNISNLRELQIFFAIFFILSVTISGFTRISFIKYSTNLSFKIGENIGESVFAAIIKRPYEYHMVTNSSESINTVIVKVNEIVYGLIFPLIVIISSIIMIIMITLSIVFVNPIVAISCLIIFTSTYLIISMLSKAQLVKNSLNMTYGYTKLAKVTQESLGSIKEIILTNKHDIFIDEFRKINYNLRKSQASNMYISQSPRFVIESLGFIIIAIFVILISKEQNKLLELLPILGLMIIGAQRLLPLLHQVYSSWSAINSNSKNIHDIVEVLNVKNLVDVKIRNLQNKFMNEYFELINIKIRYENSSKIILENLNLKVKRGSRIGITGESGAGKSSLLNVIMGLYQPNHGSIYVDGKKLQVQDLECWRNIISYVPQSAYLIDGSILKNIAFGVDENNINEDKVISIAKELKLDGMIENLKNRYHSELGENGVFFSGGERQRIAIARALYRESQILIFDEPTSSLDKHSEAIIMDLIYSLSKDLTIIIVSHNIESLKNCDYVYRLIDNNLSEINLNEIN